MADRTALVLSAGGMFGAYQAGAWEVLENCIAPDIVVGASIGSVNAWAIGGGCSAAELISRWLELAPSHRNRFRLPRAPLDGFIDAGPFETWLQEWHARYRPRVDIGVVLTDLLKLEPLLVRTDITWLHLAASCAVLGAFPQRNIGGRLYTDGGLLNVLPVWAAQEMGARRIVAVNVLPHGLPLALVRGFLRGVRRLSRFRPPATSAELTLIQPAKPLGRLGDLLSADPHAVERWIEQGRADATRALPDLRGSAPRG